jgi:membrane protein implicated in regulation of membrane protease activity
VIATDEFVERWWAWGLGALVAALVLGYACATDNRAGIVLALITVVACAFSTRRLHRRDVDEAEARTRSVARLRGLP